MKYFINPKYNYYKKKKSHSNISLIFLDGKISEGPEQNLKPRKISLATSKNCRTLKNKQAEAMKKKKKMEEDN